MQVKNFTLCNAPASINNNNNKLVRQRPCARVVSTQINLWNQPQWKKYDWVWLPKPHPAFLFSPFSVAIGRLCCDSLFHLENLSQWTISCSLPAFVVRSLSDSMGTEVNHARAHFWLCQTFPSATAPTNVQLKKCSYKMFYSFTKDPCINSVWFNSLPAALEHSISWLCLSHLMQYVRKFSSKYLPDLHLMMSLNSSLVPPSAVSPCDAIVANKFNALLVENVPYSSRSLDAECRSLSYSTCRWGKTLKLTLGSRLNEKTLSSVLLEWFQTVGKMSEEGQQGWRCCMCLSDSKQPKQLKRGDIAHRKVWRSMRSTAGR